MWCKTRSSEKESLGMKMKMKTDRRVVVVDEVREVCLEDFVELADEIEEIVVE